MSVTVASPAPPIDAASTYRVGGGLLLAGALSMFAGAAVWASTGTDIDAAVTHGDLVAYLAAATQHASALMLNLALWIVGVSGIGVGGALLATGGRSGHPLQLVGSVLYVGGACLGITSFFLMMGIVRAAADIDAAVAPLAFAASRLDWFATSLVVGFGPLAVATAGRRRWVPTWLWAWSLLTALAGMLTWVALVTGALGTYGFVVVPLGLSWSVAASVTALRYARTASSNLR